MLNVDLSEDERGAGLHVVGAYLVTFPVHEHKVRLNDSPPPKERKKDISSNTYTAGRPRLSRPEGVFGTRGRVAASLAGKGRLRVDSPVVRIGRAKLEEEKKLRVTVRRRAKRGWRTMSVKG